jgi:N-formylglutamate amidohydrolase
MKDRSLGFGFAIVGFLAISIAPLQAQQSAAPAVPPVAPAAQNPATQNPAAANRPAGGTIRGATDRLIDVHRGTIPIIISAPHGGTEDVPGVPPRVNAQAYRFVTGGDTNSRELAQKLVADLERRLGGKPYYVMARFKRRYLDVNRKPADSYESPRAAFYYQAYHETLAEYVREVQEKFGGGLLIDVHGQATYKDDILVGTVGGKSMERIRLRLGDGVLVGREGIVGLLESSGFRVQPAIDATDFNVPRYNGGEITQAYGSDKPEGIDAVQFEFGSNYRVLDRLDKSASMAAEAVEKFYRANVAKADTKKASD